jgi:hypothetical protein
MNIQNSFHTKLRPCNTDHLEGIHCKELSKVKTNLAITSIFITIHLISTLCIYCWISATYYFDLVYLLGLLKESLCFHKEWNLQRQHIYALIIKLSLLAERERQRTNKDMFLNNPHQPCKGEKRHTPIAVTN